MIIEELRDFDFCFNLAYDIQFYRTEYSLVNQKIKQISYESEDEKEEKLFQLLNDFSEPTIVYVRSPKRSEDLAKKYIEQFSLEKEKSFPVFDWIDENISSNWILKKYLKNGIGLHNGQYPRHIVNSQLDYFNSGDLKIIFATTSLIEGVNSIAKNVVIYDMFKGTRKITYFDFNNIKGRAGRMMKYYTGNIFYFDNPPERKDEFIDIPVVDQDDNLQSEILLNIDENDLKQSKQEEFQKLVEGIPEDLIEIFKNNYYNVEKQKSLYINSLNQHKSLANQIIKYDAFTDIEFNPEKSKNCQAEACSIYIFLYKSGLLDFALSSKENFLKAVYKEKSKNKTEVISQNQGIISLFEEENDEIE